MYINDDVYCSSCMRKLDKYEKTCPYCKYDHSTKRHDDYILQEYALLQDGRYQIGAVIGKGGFGIIYAAFDFRTNQPVAIKEYFPLEYCERDSKGSNNVNINPSQEPLYYYGLNRFVEEGRMLGTLENVSNIVRIIDRFEENSTAYNVMEYIRGVSIGRYVMDNKIPPRKIIEMVKGIIEALVLVHRQGIFHLDISPSNILVQNGGRLILIDFGAASIGRKDILQPGNRKYAPIEQLDENGVIGSYTDVYALSATLYYLLCGEPPPEALARQLNDNIIPLRARNVKIKSFQAQTIMEGLALRYEDRVQSMETFKVKLYNELSEEEIKRRGRLRLLSASFAAVFSILSTLVTLNFTYGLFLGDGLRYSLRADGFHVLGFSYDREILIIPAKKFGVKVSRVDKGAFQGAEILSNVSVPGSVEEIGEFAFNGCKNLINVILNEGVKELSNQAFANCDSLQVVITPDTIENIHVDTFMNSQRRLVLLGNLQSKVAIISGQLGLNFAHIETKPNETGITILKYESEQANVNVPDFIDGRPVTVLESGVKEQSVFCKTVRGVNLPAYLEKIGDYAFYHTYIKEIDFPETLEYIGNFAFSMSLLENVNLPESVNFVGTGAFSICLLLESAKLSPNMKEVPSSCFQADDLLRSVTIPEGITRIKDDAFCTCNKLSSIEVPDGVKIIDDGAFMDCTALEVLYLPPSLDYIHISALEGCPKSLTVTGYKNTYVEYICAEYGFRFYNLRENFHDFVIVPNGNLSVRRDINESETVKFPSYSLYSRDVTATVVLDARALKSRKAILPERLETIFHKAFEANNYLESVDCPPTLKFIGARAFASCKNLTSINLHEGLEEISMETFSGCKKLSDIELPSSLKIIRGYAFADCTSLKKLKLLPNKVGRLIYD